MNINMGGMANGNSSVNVQAAPQSVNSSGLVSINSSQTAKAALAILRSLSGGESFSANITDVKGSMVTITLDGGQTFTANMLNYTAYNIGDRANFILQSNQGDSIVLKALPMEETAFETNMINQSLDVAGLASSGRNRELVLELMHNNMPISKDALGEMVKELTVNPDASVKDIVALKRMGMEINKENLDSYENYKDYNGALQRDINTLTDSINTVVKDGESLKNIVRLLTGAEGTATETTAAGTEEKKDAALSNSDVAEGQMPQINAGDKEIHKPQETQELTHTDALPMDREQSTSAKEIIDSLGKMLDNYQAATGRTPESGTDFLKSMQNMENINLKDFLTGLAKTITELENEPLLKKKLHELIKGDKIQRLISGLIRDTFSMKPADLKDGEVVKEHIARSINKLNELAEYAQENGNKLLSDASSKMSSNMEFLNNMNQFVALAQIPLHRIGEKGEGELYVYRRKKVKEDDTVNAFLHLDMEHLGALDIYVTLRRNNVSTNFKVEDVSVLDFLEENMHLLTKKLNEDGYNVTASVTNMESDDGFDFVKEVLMPELPVNDIKRFRFDVKA